jgi:cell fate regulator YaaT (PSP1 superfamily)
VDHLIEVAFKGNRREFFRWAFEAPPPVRAAIIVDVERGEHLGHVHAIGELAERRKAGTTHGKEQREPLHVALRLATLDDITKANALREEEETTRRYAVQKARALNLQMKISDAEWQWDRRRLTFYFTAEERVDFRSLVRQLEGHFGVRVQMWHIGPRDEAKRLDGVGHCGRQLCSSSWLPELLPVKTSLAKEQRLSTITPTQISGACGRLMCCLRYEHEFYVAARKRFPKQGKIVATAQGDEKIESTDIFRDTVSLRNPAGEVRTIPLAQFKRELAGETIPIDDDVRDDDAVEEIDDRLLLRQPPVQMQRAPAPASTRDAPKPREPRPESRPEPRSNAAQSAGANAQRDTRRDPPHTPVKPDPRRESPREAQRPPRDQRPGTPSVPPAPVAPAPTAAKLPPADETVPVVPATPPQDTSPTDGDQRRSRRRRGRRGGRRHRGDGHAGPQTPPSHQDD